MPVTVVVASHPAEEVRPVHLPELSPGSRSRSKQEPGGPSTRLLRCTAPEQSKSLKRVLQSTVADEVASKILPMKNGLVHTCLEAYNLHHHLVLRPDDIWIAIITQFSSYVNKNAEQMRSLFVAHKGKKELVITEDISDFNFSRMTAKMAEKVQDNVLDKDLHAWIIPAFSTTTLVDTIVCSTVMMSTMKQYFAHRFNLMCGIPSVTLLGEISDWESILQRLDKLASFGPDHQNLASWKDKLTPILQNIIQAFHDPEAAAQVEFWSKIAHYEGGGSGPTYLSGWITAFCAFTDKGVWQGENYIHNQGPQLSLVDSVTKETVLYPAIDSQDVPSGQCEVDVRISGAMELDAAMVAGLVGASVFSNRMGENRRDTVQPFPAWWIFETEKKQQGAPQPQRLPNRS